MTLVEQYTDLVNRSYDLWQIDEDDSPEADAIRNQQAVIWQEMTEEERDNFRNPISRAGEST